MAPAVDSISRSGRNERRTAAHARTAPPARMTTPKITTSLRVWSIVFSTPSRGSATVIAPTTGPSWTLRNGSVTARHDGEGPSPGTVSMSYCCWSARASRSALSSTGRPASFAVEVLNSSCVPASCSSTRT